MKVKRDNMAKESVRIKQNQVFWAVKKKNFIREHSLDYPKPIVGDIGTGLLVFSTCVFFIGLIIAGFANIWPFKIAFVGLTAAFLTLLLVLAFVSEYRSKRFYLNLLERGGTTANTLNERMIKGKGGPLSVVVIVSVLVIYVLSIVTIILYTFSSHPTAVNPVFSLSMIWFYNIRPRFSYPCVFMDIDEGMTLGGALFSYDIFKGIRETDGGFELYFEDTKVAWGRLFPEDMKLLKEIAGVREKYDIPTDYPPAPSP
ncbi:MAG: hypothetical protein LBS19_09775 [Clostridiales bacterium]|jgi:uncharacterized membrane protein|nr:hypothetical protein [Clostridiales bacterium]